MHVETAVTGFGQPVIKLPPISLQQANWAGWIEMNTN
jgi:hypothetical protein